MNKTEKIQALFQSQLCVINVGPRLFAQALEKQNTEVIQVAWQPVAGGDRRMQEILAELGGV